MSLDPAGGDGARPAAGRDAGRAGPDRGRDGRGQSAAAQAGGAGERHPEGEGAGTRGQEESLVRADKLTSCGSDPSSNPEVFLGFLSVG